MQHILALNVSESKQACWDCSQLWEELSDHKKLKDVNEVNVQNRCVYKFRRRTSSSCCHAVSPSLLFLTVIYQQVTVMHLFKSWPTAMGLFVTAAGFSMPLYANTLPTSSPSSSVWCCVYTLIKMYIINFASHHWCVCESRECWDCLGISAQSAQHPVKKKEKMKWAVTLQITEYLLKEVKWTVVQSWITPRITPQKSHWKLYCASDICSKPEWE